MQTILTALEKDAISSKFCFSRTRLPLLDLPQQNYECALMKPTPWIQLFWNTKKHFLNNVGQDFQLHSHIAHFFCFQSVIRHCWFYWELWKNHSLPWKYSLLFSLVNCNTFKPEFSERSWSQYYLYFCFFFPQRTNSSAFWIIQKYF